MATRTVLVREYFGVDLGEVWQTVAHDLPDLKRTVEGLLRSLEEQE